MMLKGCIINMGLGQDCADDVIKLRRIMWSTTDYFICYKKLQFQSCIKIYIFHHHISSNINAVIEEILEVEVTGAYTVCTGQSH